MHLSWWWVGEWSADEGPHVCVGDGPSRIVGGRSGCFDPGVLEPLAVNYLRYYAYRRVV